MSLPRGYWFSVPHSDAFPAGALVTGEIVAATERQSQEDRQRGRVARQRLDADTGLKVWHVTVTDPAARARESAALVEIVAADEPELPEPVAGMSMAVREVEFVGLRVQPRVGGSGEVRWLTWAYRADGVRAAGLVSRSGRGSGRGGRSSSGESGSGGGVSEAG